MTQKIGRLALRVEGEYWNAYYALPDTMKDAIHLGSIRMVFVLDHEERKRTFMVLMQEAVGDLIQDATGKTASWPAPAQAAPENERSGSA